MLNFNILKTVPTLRFGDNTDQPDLRRYFTDLTKATQGDLVFLSANQDRVDTAFSRIRAKKRHGLKALGLLGGSLILTLTSLFPAYLYRSSQPDATVKSEFKTLQPQNPSIAPHWRNLVSAANTYRGTAKTPESRAAFEEAIRSFQFILTKTLADNAVGTDNADLIETIQAKVATNADFSPAALGTDIAFRFVDYYNQQNLGSDPSRSAVNAAMDTIYPRILEDYPELGSLNTTSQGTLRQDLINEILEITPKEIGPDALENIFTGYLDSGIHGLNLEDFSSIQSESDAITLFTTIVSNEENYPNLSPAERKNYISFGTALLDAIDLSDDQPGGMPLAAGIAVYLLLGVLGATTASIAVKKRHQLLGLAQVATDYHAALNEPPILYITNAHNGDLNSEAAVEKLSRNVEEQLQDMEDVLQKAREEDSQAKDILKEIFENSLPDDNWFRKTHSQISAKSMAAALSEKQRRDETPVYQQVFVERLNSQLESSLLTGDILGLSYDPSVETVKDDPEADDVTRLENERTRIDKMVNNYALIYLKLVFSVTAAKIQLEKLDKKQRGITTRTDLEESEKNQQIAEIEQSRPFIQNRLEQYQQMWDEARTVLKGHVQRLRDKRDRINQAIVTEDQTITLNAQNEVVDRTSGATLLDMKADELAMQAFFAAESQRTLAAIGEAVTVSS